MTQNSTLRPKLHINVQKTAARAVHDMKTMIQPPNRSYCSSVASEIGTPGWQLMKMGTSSPKIGPEGDKIKKNMTQNSTLRPKLHVESKKLPARAVHDMKMSAGVTKSHTGGANRP